MTECDHCGHDHIFHDPITEDCQICGCSDFLHPVPVFRKPMFDFNVPGI